MQENLELKEWFEKFIDQFRAESDKLAPHEKEAMNYDDNFSAPCQVEVVATKEPDYQIVIISRFEERLDRDIIAHEAVDPWNVVEKCEQILQEPRWAGPVPEGSAVSRAWKSVKTLKGILEIHLAMAIRGIQFDVLSRAQRPYIAVMHPVLSSPDLRMWSVVGNIAKMNQEKLVDDILKRVRSNAAYIKRTENNDRSRYQPQVKLLKGHTTSFFPPVIIGAVPKPMNLGDRVYRSYITDWMLEKIQEMQYAGGHLTVQRDGNMTLTLEEKSSARAALNVIHGVAYLMGIPARIVRDSEIGECEVDQSDWHIETSSGGSSRYKPSRLESIPTAWMQEVAMLRGRTKLTPERLNDILQKSETILKIPEKAEQLILLLEAATYLEEREMSQSLVIAWLIIERHYSKLWHQYLIEKGLDFERIRRLEQGTFARTCEELNLSGLIDSSTYESLDSLRIARNEFIHEAKDIDQLHASHALKMAEAITRESLTGFIST